MPKNNKVNILQPEYVSRFACIGGACEDNCCEGGWNIYVDKKTFLKYRSATDLELKSAFDQFIKRNRKKDASDAQYAYLRLLRSAANIICPFLTQDKLCLIVGKYGNSYQCDVCAMYPRLYRMVDKKLERSITMSCPEAVRVALNNPDGIAFEMVEENRDANRIPSRAPSVNSQSTKFAAKPIKFFAEIRLYCLSILQNRTYTLGQRFIILGMLCQKLDDHDNSGRVEEIPAMLEKFGQIIESEELKAELETVKSDFKVQLRLTKELNDNRLSHSLIASRIYVDCVKEMLAGLNCFTDTPAEDILKKYIENQNNYVQPYIKEKGYVLENFFVNEFFAKTIPFNDVSCWSSYIYLCVLYGMMRLHINGMGGFHKGIDDAMVFRLIQAFTKVTTHNSTFMPAMVDLIKASGFDTLAGMTMLVGD